MAPAETAEEDEGHEVAERDAEILAASLVRSVLAGERAVDNEQSTKEFEDYDGLGFRGFLFRRLVEAGRHLIDDGSLIVLFVLLHECGML